MLQAPRLLHQARKGESLADALAGSGLGGLEHSRGLEEGKSLGRPVPLAAPREVAQCGCGPYSSTRASRKSVESLLRKCISSGLVLAA